MAAAYNAGSYGVSAAYGGGRYSFVDDAVGDCCAGPTFVGCPKMWYALVVAG